MATENWVKLNLPSQCLVYPDVKKEDVQIRAFKGKDEKLVAELTSDNFDKKSLAVLRQVTKGIDPAKLTLGDRMYILLWEAINSYSKDFTVEFECEHCWQKSEYVVDLSKDIDSKNLPADYAEPYSVTLPESKDTIKLKLLRVDDLIKSDELHKSGKNIWLFRYALSIVDNEKGIWDKMEYLENLGTKDLMVIRAFQDKFQHGPDMKYSYTCKKCEATGVMPVPFRLEMLLPYGEGLRKRLGDAV